MNITEVGMSKKCTGCSACAYSCPTDAISMQEDIEGFWSPFVRDELCSDCGKCLRLCPSINSDLYKHRIMEADSYIVQSRNPERKKSASGGAFLAIADAVIRGGGVAFGAAFDDENVVRHICISNLQDLKRLQNSKYVQSNIGKTYCLAKELLESGKTVLFSGTPCQVAGLYAYLNRDYERLVTVDIICHGCPSPKLLKKQVEEESKSWQGKVKRLSFRYKNPLFKTSSSFYMIMMMMRGLPIVRRPADDPYFNIFSKGYAFRESCYTCPYASPDRIGDFTIGDCDSHSLYEDFHPNESNSTVILNSDKARDFWNKTVAMSCDYEKLDINEEIKHNKQLGRPAERPEQRNHVYIDLEKMTWDDFAGKYANRQSKLGKFRSYMSLFMPSFIVRLWGKLHG